MAENTVSVDLDAMRTLADRVERNADALRRFCFPGIDRDMAGSATAAAMSPDRVAARFDTVVAGMLAWVCAARTSARAFDGAEQDNTRRISGS